MNYVQLFIQVKLTSDQFKTYQYPLTALAAGNTSLPTYSHSWLQMCQKLEITGQVTDWLLGGVFNNNVLRGSVSTVLTATG